MKIYYKVKTHSIKIIVFGNFPSYLAELAKGAFAWEWECANGGSEPGGPFYQEEFCCYSC